MSAMAFWNQGGGGGLHQGGGLFGGQGVNAGGQGGFPGGGGGLKTGGGLFGNQGGFNPGGVFGQGAVGQFGNQGGFNQGGGGGLNKGGGLVGGGGGLGGLNPGGGFGQGAVGQFGFPGNAQGQGLQLFPVGSQQLVVKEDLNLIKYEDLADAKYKPQHNSYFLRALYRDINLVQHFIDAQDRLCDEISKDLLKTHQSMMRKLDQDVYRLEQSCKEMENLFNDQKSTVDGLNHAMREMDRNQTDVSIAFKKIKSKTPISSKNRFFPTLIRQIEEDVEYGKAAIQELYLAMRPEEAAARAQRDREVALLREQRTLYNRMFQQGSAQQVRDDSRHNQW